MELMIPVSHISRPGETISSHGFQQRMGGKGFNQAVAVALATGGGSQGKVSFYGTVGDDDAGRGLKEKLHRVWGLNNEFLVLDPVSYLVRSSPSLNPNSKCRPMRRVGQSFRWQMMERTVLVSSSSHVMRQV